MSVTFSGGGVTISGGGWTLTAAPPAGNKAIFGYGNNGGATTYSITNLVSNTGVVASDQAALTGTARYSPAAASYGGDKAIFGYGLGASSTLRNITNLISNTGVVATDSGYGGVGTARFELAAAGYSS